MSKITIGCDPELFVLDTKTNKFVSAHDLFPGTKQKPYKVIKGAVQVDGVAFEFNIQPAESLKQFLQNIEAVTNTMKFFASKVNPDLSLVVIPTAVFDREYFDALPLYALSMGCDPDFDAYTGKENPKPETLEPFRTGSGHIHVGWTEGEEPHDAHHFYDCIQTVKQLDAAMFLPSLIWDNDRKRRELYGKMGAFRPKTYGVEWRTLSNAWVADPDLSTFIFDSTKKAVELIQDDERIYENKFVSFYLDIVREGGELDVSDITKYCDYLYTEYAFPQLPPFYLEA